VIRAFPVLSQAAISPRVTAKLNLAISIVFTNVLVKVIVVVAGEACVAAARLTSFPVVASKLSTAVPKLVNVPVIAADVNVKAPPFRISTIKLLVAASFPAVIVTTDPEISHLLAASECTPGALFTLVLI